MRKALVGALVLIVMLSLLPFGAEAGRWERNSVPFYDYTFSRMEESVHEWNAARQPGQPTLRYIAKKGTPCKKLDKKNRAPTFGIYACSGKGTGVFGITIFRDVRDKKFRLIQIKIMERAHRDKPPEELNNTHCHEAGHALGLNHPRGSDNSRSCLGDTIPLLLQPGQWDMDTLRDLYGRKHLKRGGRK